MYIFIFRYTHTIAIYITLPQWSNHAFQGLWSECDLEKAVVSHPPMVGEYLSTLHDHAGYLQKWFVSSFQHEMPGVPSQPCFNFAFLCCFLTPKCHVWVRFQLFATEISDSSFAFLTPLLRNPRICQCHQCSSNCCGLASWHELSVWSLWPPCSCPYSDWAENAGGIKRSLVY